MLRSVHWRLVDANTIDDFERARRDVLTAAVAVAHGDWSYLTGEATSGRGARLVAVGRRVVVAAVLVLTALALPHLLGVPLGNSAVTTVQIGLYVTAVLALTADQSGSQDRVMSLFTGS